MRDLLHNKGDHSLRPQLRVPKTCHSPHCETQFNLLARSWYHSSHLNLRTDPLLLAPYAGHRFSETSTFRRPFLHLEAMDLSSAWWGEFKTAVNCSAKNPSGDPVPPLVFSVYVEPYKVSYFSLLGDQTNLASLVKIYCLNPPPNDGCPVDVCPNPDIAGMLVRIARAFPFPLL